MPPVDHLTSIARRYPEGWRMADFCRADRTGLPAWPAWCFLPLAAWHSIVAARTGSIQPPLGMAADISRLAALGAWRYSQGIYTYDTDIMKALADTSIAGALPADVLMRLPEWCIYIETPGAKWADQFSYGFFSFLEWDTEDAHTELRLLFDMHSGQLLPAPPIYLGKWPLVDSLAKGLSTIKESPHLSGAQKALAENTFSQKLEKDLYTPLALLLYLCSDSPDIAGHVPGEYPARPKPKKTKRGWRLFPPDKPHIWRVGATAGDALRQAATEAKKSTDKSGLRPHIRRAHWHGFWSGPKDIPEKRRFRYQWMPPLVIGVEKND